MTWNAAAMHDTDTLGESVNHSHLKKNNEEIQPAAAPLNPSKSFLKQSVGNTHSDQFSPFKFLSRHIFLFARFPCCQSLCTSFVSTSIPVLYPQQRQRTRRRRRERARVGAHGGNQPAMLPVPKRDSHTTLVVKEKPIALSALRASRALQM